ncbi:MAG: endo-1,4-beta-xylanase [Candidatus Fervidibacter sp.]|uniref:endo-1,4-beta-xylanase n=1 Tax=Candidatus Fervidibacter sp. TaxID=3100871 RepID=UPI004049005A
MRRRQFLKTVALNWAAQQEGTRTTRSAERISLLHKTAERIERHRKRDATLEFIAPNGSPTAGADVQVSQQSHDFLFGCPLRPRHYNDPRHLELFKQLFNLVALLEFNWGQYEPDMGKPLSEERKRFIYEWCLPQGISHFYGHMLVWTRQYGEYPKTALPLWLFRYDLKTQYELLKKRIQREVKDYSDIDIVWDVVNEPIHCRAWGEWDKPNRFDEPIGKVFTYVADALLWAHEANPKATLLINEYDLFASKVARERFIQLLKMLLEKGVPIHAVGIQAHDLQATYWPAPEEIWEACEIFGTSLGLDIYFTELCYPSDPKQEIRGLYRSGFWSPENQADAVEEFYRVAFGHSRVRGIIYFGLVGSEIWRPTTGLLDESFKPKPVWDRLRRLREEWWTRESGRTTKEGIFQFRGFEGEYLVKVSFQGQTYTFKFCLKKGHSNRWQFVLSDKSTMGR